MAATINQLKIFCEVAKCKNMSRAAENLFLAQSSISKTITELERYYNTHLFERLAKKLFLTSSGEELYHCAQELLQHYNKMDTHIKDFCNTSTIRIGSSATAGTYIMSTLVERLKQALPNSNPQVFVYSIRNLESRLMNSEIDIALCDSAMDNLDFVSIPVISNELILVCSPNHPFYHCDTLSVKELNDQPFIFRENHSGIRRIIETFFHENNIHVKTAWTCNNIEAIKNATLANQGISIIPRNAIKQELENQLLKELPIYDETFKREFSLVYHKNKHMPEVMATFIQLCQTYSNLIN